MSDLNNSPAVGIIGVGHAVPVNVVSNEDLVARGLDTSDTWIKERSGIVERRIQNPDLKTSDLAIEAAKKAIKNAELVSSQIDLIIVATATPDYNGFPSTACVVMKSLGIHDVPAFDLSAACTGFNYALTCAQQFVATNQAKNALIIGADCLSKIVNWQDRSTCILFADGAGAAVISKTQSQYGILASKLFADGNYLDVLTVEHSKRESFHQKGSLINGPTIKMNGRAVFKLAVEKCVSTLNAVLQSSGYSFEDVDHIILHQANLRIIKAVCNRVGLSEDKMIVNLQRFGNTSAASIPIALSEAVSNHDIRKGEILVLLGFGAGFTWGAHVIKWSQ